MKKALTRTGPRTCLKDNRLSTVLTSASCKTFSGVLQYLKNVSLFSILSYFTKDSSIFLAFRCARYQEG